MAGTGLHSRGPLTGRYITLAPLTLAHASQLVHAGRDPEVGRFLRQPPPRTVEEATDWIARVTADRNSGARLPFATVLRANGLAIGVTGYPTIDRVNRSVEIGGTWLDSAFWRTPINSESKYLLLSHAFETEGMHRVWLRTDARNIRSQRAIERLGAIEECRRREDVPLTDGFYRTSVVYGILESEWPTVRDRLQRALERPWSPPVGLDASSRSASSGAGAASPGAAIPPLSPTAFRPPVELRGRFVHLGPVDRAHLPGLARAGADPEVWTHLRIRHGDSLEGMAGLVDDLLRQQAHGEVLAFTIFVGEPERPAGITRFLDIDRTNRLAEIGTWIDRTLWGTPVNTEVKRLMLGHAFEKEGAHRVELRTDERNARSQRAIERIGAVREGHLREHYLLTSGRFRTSVYYSILESEWSGVRARLYAHLARPWSRPL